MSLGDAEQASFVFPQFGFQSLSIGWPYEPSGKGIHLRNLARAELVRFSPFLLALAALLAVFILPVDNETRSELLLIAGVSAVYAGAIHLPILKDGQTPARAAYPWIIITHTIVISFVVATLGEKVPMVATIYLISIAAVAIRRGLKYGMVTALLSSLAYLITLTWGGAFRPHVADFAALIIVFFLVALMVGAVAQTAMQQVHQFENVVTRSRETIVILNAEGKLEYINPAGLALGGFATKDVLGRSFFDFIVEEDQANARAIWDSLATRQTPVEVIRLRIFAKDGSPRTLAVTLTTFDSKPTRYMAIARDITTTEAEHAAHERRHRELEAERAVASAVSQSLDLQSVLDLALEQALTALQVDAGAIYLADNDQTELTLAVFRHPSPEYASRWKTHRFGEGITGLAAAKRETILVPDLDHDARVSMERRESPRLLSQVSVPLIARDRVVGVLNVNGYEPQHFTENDAALLRAIAASVAVAIDHARLFETLEQRVADRTAELSALNRIAIAVNQSLDLNEVLETALEEITHTLQVRGGWIYLLDADRDELILRARRGATEKILAHYHSIHVGIGPVGQMVQTHQPFAANLENFVASGREPLAAAGYRSMCGVPLLIKGHAVGVLGLASEQPDRFGEADIQWLAAVGNTIGVALKNAGLFESVERQLKQVSTLREIDRTLSSMLDLGPMLEATLSRLEEIVPYTGAAVLMLDENMLRAVAARGRDEALLRQFVLDITDNVFFREMDSQRAPIVIDDLTNSPGWVRVPGVEYARSWLGAPLVARGELIGQLSLFSAMPRAFTQEHSDLLLAYATHAAIAIANARLNAELNVQARRDSLTQVLNHGTFIAELSAAVAEARAFGHPMSMIMFDIDNFKTYNDSYGHVVGDLVLTTTVQAIRAHIKHTDLVGRWGGEEFAIGLREADIPNARQVAERIRETLASTPVVDRAGRSIQPPTASQGIACFPDTARDVDELIEQADRALYHAKSRGRDQVATAN